MKDKKYQAFLEMLARRYVRLDRVRRHTEGMASLSMEVERLSRLARMLAVAAEEDFDASFSDAVDDVKHADSPQSRYQKKVRGVSPDELLPVVIRQLRRARVDFVAGVLDDCGILDAIDEDPATLFGEMRVSAIPAEDYALFRDAGIRDPDAEVALLVRYARNNLAKRTKSSPSEIMVEASNELRLAADYLEQPGPSPRRNPAPAVASATSKSEMSPPKKRKIFNGTGKILGGFVAAGGNALLGLGVIAAPSPATGSAVITSVGIAIASVFQGIGDLRGE